MLYRRAHRANSKPIEGKEHQRRNKQQISIAPQIYDVDDDDHTIHVIAVENVARVFVAFEIVAQCCEERRQVSVVSRHSRNVKASRGRDV